MADEFEISAEMKKSAPDCVKLLETIVKSAQIAANQGSNIPLCGLGIKAATTMLAYGFGTPISRTEHSGEVKVGHGQTIDPKQMSTEALIELRKALKAAPAVENKD